MEGDNKIVAAAFQNLVAGGKRKRSMIGLDPSSWQMELLSMMMKN